MKQASVGVRTGEELHRIQAAEGRGGCGRRHDGPTGAPTGGRQSRDCPLFLGGALIFSGSSPRVDSHTYSRPLNPAADPKPEGVS